MEGRWKCKGRISSCGYESGKNWLATITGTPTATLTHDANGNTVSEGTRTFVYDLSNRLVSVLDNSTEIVSYIYDARNLRVRKTTPAMTTVFHYDINGRLIAETDTAGNTLAEYVYLDDMPLATIRPTDAVYYYHAEHINTPRVMTNSSGTVAWRAAFHAFGYAEVDGSSTITNNIRFPGQYFDSETNLHYNWNRYYDPRTGRYLTPDPIGLEGGIDPFVYVNNRPTNEMDLWGLVSVNFNAGAHIWLPPTAGAYGANFSSEWRGLNPSTGSKYAGMKQEFNIGSLVDVGVSVAAAGFSPCKDGRETSLSITHPLLGKYGGIQIGFKGGKFDSIGFGLGRGLSLPVTYTIPGRDLRRR